MTEPPWVITIEAPDRASEAADHHDLALQRPRRGTGVTRIADAAVNIPKPLADVSNLQPFQDNACPAIYPRDKKTRFGKCRTGERRGTAARVA